LQSDDSTLYEQAADALLALDVKEGTAILLQKKYWTFENEERLPVILGALVRNNAEVPAVKLLDLESQLRPYLAESAASVVKFRFARAGGQLLSAYEHLLLLMGQNKTPGAREIIRKARKSWPDLADQAAQALAVLDDFPDPFEFIRSLCQQVGFDGLSEKQKLFFAVDELYWRHFESYFIQEVEIGNEGDDGENWSDKDWSEYESFQDELTRREQYALQGLKTIGATKAARAFRKALNGADWEKAEEQFCNAESIQALLMDFCPEEHQGLYSKRHKLRWPESCERLQCNGANGR
jgi:hypothetical protein